VTASKLAPGIWYCFDPATNTEPMPNRGADLPGLLKLTAVVAAAGCALPAEYVAMRDRFQGFSQLAASHAPTMLERLIDALRTGQGDPELWFAAAMAGAGPGHIERRSEVLSMLHTAMEGHLRVLYERVAAPNYRALSKRFNEAAAGFMRAADVIDPGTDAAAVVNAGDRALRAWRDAAAFASQLDNLLPALTAAAELARPVTSPTGLGVSRDVFTLPLAADVDDIHSRVAWHAWLDWPQPTPVNTVLSIESMTAPPTDQPIGTRCGRWTRLWRIDAGIRAHPSPAELVLHGQPQPVGVKETMLPGHRRPVLAKYDPEGELPTAAPPKRRLRDLFRRTAEATPAEPEVDIMSTVALDNEGDE